MPQSSVRRLVVDDKSGAVIGAELWQFEAGSRAAKRHRRLSRWAEQMQYPAPGVADMLRRRALAVELADARPLLVRASAGVILSTGGFIFNREMVERHAPNYLRNFRLGTSGCDGSGIRLGESAGGEAARLERVSAWRFINPPLAWARGMIVNTHGARFCNEEVYGARLGFEMCEHHGGKAFLVIDSTIRRDAVKEALSGRLWGFQSIPALVLTYAGAKRGKSIGDLARRIGADPSALRQSWHVRQHPHSRQLPAHRHRDRDLQSERQLDVGFHVDVLVHVEPTVAGDGVIRRLREQVMRRKAGTFLLKGHARRLQLRVGIDQQTVMARHERHVHELADARRPGDGVKRVGDDIDAHQLAVRD